MSRAPTSFLHPPLAFKDKGPSFPYTLVCLSPFRVPSLTQSEPTNPFARYNLAAGFGGVHLRPRGRSIFEFEASLSYKETLTMKLCFLGLIERETKASSLLVKPDSLSQDRLITPTSIFAISVSKPPQHSGILAPPYPLLSPSFSPSFIPESHGHFLSVLDSPEPVSVSRPWTPLP